MAQTLNKILILGTGGFAHVAADIISDIPGYQACGFVENLDKNRCRQPICGLPVHWIGDAHALSKDHLAVCCLGTTKRHKLIDEALAAGFEFTTIVHPTSHISKKSTLDRGCFIGPGVIISTNTHLGEHVRVNRGVLIGHDTTIDAFSTIQPGANIAGRCHIERCCYIGMSATVIDSLKIGRQSVIGAGAVVTKDVPEKVMTVGIPAKIIREGIDGM